MGKSRKGTVTAILIMGMGVAWLLNVLELFPRVDWLWTVGLGLAGVLTLVFGGLNRLTLVAGPLLLAASALSIFRQQWGMPAKYEIPVLTIVLGFFLLVGSLMRLPVPEALRGAKEEGGEES